MLINNKGFFKCQITNVCDCLGMVSDLQDFFVPPIKVFHKLSTIQEYQLLSFSCTIRKELDQWSLQHWNVILIHPHIFNFIFNNIIFCKLKKETVNMWEYKVGNNANIANFVCLWETRLRRSLKLFFVLTSWIANRKKGNFSFFLFLDKYQSEPAVFAI